MVLVDDVIDVMGGDINLWKMGKIFMVFDICCNYEGDGFGDWRFLWFFELVLFYLNRGSLEVMRGFVLLSGIYWSGLEYLVSDLKVDKRYFEQVWGINFDVMNLGNVVFYDKIMKKFKIWCV